MCCRAMPPGADGSDPWKRLGGWAEDEVAVGTGNAPGCEDDSDGIKRARSHNQGVHRKRGRAQRQRTVTLPTALWVGKKSPF